MASPFEVRLFIEELAFNICRFAYVENGEVSPETVRIRQEFQLGEDAFADALVQIPGRMTYFLEVDYGYSEDQILASVNRKFSVLHPSFDEVSKLLLVIDSEVDLERVRKGVAQIIPSSWDLELWDEERLLALVRKYFGVEVLSLSAQHLYDLRLAIDQAKRRYAFPETSTSEPIDASLLWTFGYWKLRRLFEDAGREKHEILPARVYSNVVVIFSDLSGFSGYVRDTSDQRIIRDRLGAFSAKARYQIINDGGMLYMFLGDAVIGLFGIPHAEPNYIERSFECARSLLMIGDAVSLEWQRHLDRMQPVHGSHIGMAIGDLQILPLRPFSRTHLGAIGDTINIAARLSSAAQAGQIVMTNSLQTKLSGSHRALLSRTDPVEAKNVGRIQAWRFEKSGGGRLNRAGVTIL